MHLQLMFGAGTASHTAGEAAHQIFRAYYTLHEAHGLAEPEWADALDRVRDLGNSADEARAKFTWEAHAIVRPSKES